MKKSILLSVAMATTLMMSGCSQMQTGLNPKAQSSTHNVQNGTVVASKRFAVKDDGFKASEVLGGIVGGAIGGILGNQIGGGTGKTIATGAGAVGGAALGAAKAKEFFGDDKEKFNVETTIKLAGGQVIKTTNPLEEGEFRKGDKVRVSFDSSGEVDSIDFVEAEENVRIVENEKVVYKYKDRVKKIYIKPTTAATQQQKQPTMIYRESVTTDASGKQISTQKETTKIVDMNKDAVRLTNIPIRD